MPVQKRKAVSTASPFSKVTSSTQKVEEPVADEAELKNARRKELKLQAVDDIKTLATNSGIPLGRKEDMIEAVVKHEAKVRADARAHEAEIRAIVIAKKQELDALPLPELMILCKNIGVNGTLAKAARVEKLLTHWQESDGVDQALAKKAQDAREQELMAMDIDTLHKVCVKAGADPFIKEIMVDRVLRKEESAGRFSRPKLEQEDEAAQAAGKAGDMVATLIASEALRKKEKEQKRRREEEDAEKRKELKSKSVDELKKLLSNKGLDATGKKEDMIEALFQIGVQESAVIARKANLKSMAIEDLKKLVSSRGLEISKKDDMVEAVLSWEAKLRKDCEAYEAKVADVLKVLHEEFETKTAAELKGLCAEKFLKLGLAKTDRIQILLEDAKNNGEVDRRISLFFRQQRKEALLAMEKPSLKNLCDELTADAFVKPVMIERLLEREMELGCQTTLERSKKRARSS